MALTQTQKKQLEILENNPSEFLNLLKSEQILINSFQEQFYQNGKGIYHILFDSLIKEKNLENIEKYFHIFRILNDSKVTALQYSGRKTSAIDELLQEFKNKEDKGESLIEIVEPIVKKIISKETETDKLISTQHTIKRFFQFICDKTNDYNFLRNYIEEIKNKQNPGLEYFENELISIVIKSTIKNDDKVEFEKTINDLNLKNKEKEFLAQMTYGARHEKYNIVSYAIKNKAYSIADYIIREIPEISPSGLLINQTKYLQQNRINTIEIALREFDSDQKIDNQKLSQLTLSIMENFNIYDVLISHYKSKYPSNLYRPNEDHINKPKQTIKRLLEIESLRESTIGKIENIFISNEIKAEQKVDLLNKIFETKDISIIYQVFQRIKENIPEFISNAQHYVYQSIELTFVNIFSKNNYKNIPIKDQEKYLEIFDSLNEKKYISDRNVVFDETFLFNKHIAKHILNKKRFNSKEHNIYEHFLTKYLKYQTVDNDILETFKEIKSYDRQSLQVLCSIQKPLLEFFMIERKMDSKLLSLFEKKDIENSILKHEFSDTLFAKYRHHIETPEQERLFDNLVKDFLSFNFKFFNNENNQKPHFYFLFDTLTDKNILDEIQKKQNIDLQNVFNDEKFWKTIQYDETFEYVKKQIEEKNISISQDLQFSLVNSTFINSLAFLIKHHNNKIIQNDNKDTILHIAAKNDEYLAAQKIVELIPNISLIENNQNKSALSYLFVDFNKECFINEKQSSYRPAKTIVKDTFYKILDQGVTKNQTAKKTIQKQFDKYPKILDTYPDLKQLFMVKKLEVALDTTTNIIKKKKI